MNLIAELKSVAIMSKGAYAKFYYKWKQSLVSLGQSPNNQPWKWRMESIPIDYKDLKWTNVIISTKHNHWGNVLIGFYLKLQVRKRVNLYNSGPELFCFILALLFA